MIRITKFFIVLVTFSIMTFLPLSINAAPTGTISYGYDLNGHLQTVTINDSATIDFTYDKGDNRLSKISENRLVSIMYALQVLSDLNPTPQTVADINSDGKVGLAEAISLLRNAAGL